MTWSLQAAVNRRTDGEAEGTASPRAETGSATERLSGYPSAPAVGSERLANRGLKPCVSAPQAFDEELDRSLRSLGSPPNAQWTQIAESSTASRFSRPSTSTRTRSSISSRCLNRCSHAGGTRGDFRPATRCGLRTLPARVSAAKLVFKNGQLPSGLAIGQIGPSQSRGYCKIKLLLVTNSNQLRGSPSRRFVPESRSFPF